MKSCKRAVQPTRSSFESPLDLGLLTGCQDRHYAFGLATVLTAAGVTVDVIDSDEIDRPELHTRPNLRFLNFRSGHSARTSFAQKLQSCFLHYAKLLRYAATPQSEGLRERKFVNI